MLFTQIIMMYMQVARAGAVNTRTRIISHYKCFIGTIKQYPMHKTAIENGISNYKWCLIQKLPNYLVEYKQSIGITEPLDKITVNILTHFTQFNIRAYEQAFISSIIPNLNSNDSVLFTTKWHVNNISNDIYNSKPL